MAALVIDSAKMQQTASYRRLIGALLGGAIGLTYGLVSQGINHILLPGIPLYQPPLGLAGNLLLSLIWGAILGLICAWSGSAIPGIALAGAASAFTTVLRGLLNIPEDFQRLAIMGTLLFLGLVWPTMGVMAILRWAIDRQVEARTGQVTGWHRFLVPLALLPVVALAGAFAAHGEEARTVLARADAMIEEGLNAPNADALPPPLQRQEAEDFLQRAQDGYTLEWTDRNLDSYMPLRPANDFDQHSLVIARFQNGWRLICLYPTSRAAPICMGFP